jgi:hypothetical protein
MSDAELLPLSLHPIRKETNGLPLEPAMRFEEDLDLSPTLGWTGGKMLGVGFDGSFLLQSHEKIPAFLPDGFLNPFVIIAGVGKHDHIPGTIALDVVAKIQSLEIVDHSFVL